MTQENRLLNEIKNIILENIDLKKKGNNAEMTLDIDELSEVLYELTEISANEYYNTMKVNQEEEGTTARFNHWAKEHFKK